MQKSVAILLMVLCFFLGWWGRNAITLSRQDEAAARYVEMSARFAACETALAEHR
jgi:hypothetical protein